MEFLLYLESGLVHSAVLALATILFIQYIKPKKVSSTDNAIHLALENEQNNSTLLKNKALIIEQAYKDAGIKYPIVIQYQNLTLCPLIVIPREESEHHSLNDKNVYLLAGNNYDSNTTSSSWELKRKYSFEKEWDSQNLSFEVDGKPYVGELTHRHIAFIKDQLLLAENGEKEVWIANTITTPFSSKGIVEVTGGILGLPDNQLYALACHEAMHAKYYHGIISIAALLESLYISYKLNHYVLNFLPPIIAGPSAILLSLYCIAKVYFPYIKPAISRQIEKSADVMAAKEMGVATDLSEFMKNEPAFRLGFIPEVSSSSDSHPTSHERISYLSKYANKISLFNKTDISKGSKQEDDHNYPEGHLRLIYGKTH